MLGVVAKAVSQYRQHLVGAQARGADDEDVSERVFVASIAVGQRVENRVRCRVDAGLLARREVVGGWEPLTEFLAITDLRMVAESLTPIVRRQTVPFDTRG